MTPLADSDDLLLEQARRKKSWSEVARGSVEKLIMAIASDTRGTFHGLGAMDKALRQAGKGLNRLTVKREGARFVSAGTDDECSAQETLFHHFGLPLQMLVEPSEWYSYHRQPMIVEANEDHIRVMVRFGAESGSGEIFGATCLYAFRDGRWDADRLRPRESRDIATAEAWLVKRK